MAANSLQLSDPKDDLQEDLQELERLLLEIRAAIEAGLHLIEKKRGSKIERDRSSG